MIARRSLSARLLLVKSFLCVWAPHLGYLLACGVGGRIIAHLGLLGYLLPLAATSTPLLLTAIPAVRTVHALRSQRLVGRRHWLEFWVVWAALQQCIGIFQMVPLLPRLIHAHQGVHAALQMLSFCFGLWTQLPHDGVSLLFGALAPAMRLRAARFSALLPSLPQPLVSSLSLVLTGMLPGRMRTKLSEVAAEGGVLLAAALFLITPTPVTRVGLLFFSLGYPCLRSIDALKRGKEEVRTDPAHSSPLCQPQAHTSCPEFSPQSAAPNLLPPPSPGRPYPRPPHVMNRAQCRLRPRAGRHRRRRLPQRYRPDAVAAAVLARTLFRLAPALDARVDGALFWLATTHDAPAARRGGLAPTALLQRGDGASLSCHRRTHAARTSARRSKVAATPSERRLLKETHLECRVKKKRESCAAAEAVSGR